MRVYTVLLLLLMAATSAEAQAVAVSGRIVHEATGDPQARIPLYLLGTSLAAFTDSDGRYVFREVPAGSYELVAVVPGHGQIKHMLEVAGEADIVHDLAVPYASNASDESPDAAGSDSEPSSNTAPLVQRTDIVNPEVETVCSCHTSAVSSSIKLSTFEVSLRRRRPTRLMTQQGRKCNHSWANGRIFSGSVCHDSVQSSLKNLPVTSPQRYLASVKS